MKNLLLNLQLKIFAITERLHEGQGDRVTRAYNRTAKGQESPAEYIHDLNLYAFPAYKSAIRKRMKNN